jgi:hypothetical protein
MKDLPMRAWLPLALCCAACVAIAAPAGQDKDKDMLQGLHNNLVRSFVLDKDLPLEPALRAAADEIGAAHLARVDGLLPAWVAEERQLQSASGAKHEAWELYFAVWARVLNELALWQLEPGDADYERATLEVLKTSPLVCNVHGDYRFSDFSARIARVQAMPAARRDAALAAERQLLSHWGQARPAAARPEPSPQDAAAAALQPGGQKDRLALPPLLASELLADQKKYADIHREEQCLLQQWWLRESLRRGTAPAAALNAFRHGTLIGAGERLAGAFDQAGPDGKPEVATAKPAYPKVASRFLVTGTTTLSAQLDAAGKPRQISIVGRQVNVPGIRGAQPVAFETIFDQPALDYALDGYRYEPPKAGVSSKVQLVWSLPAGANK